MTNWSIYLFRYDLAHVVEVRRGHSTDTFNEVVRGGARVGSKVVTSEKCFSVIFDHRISENNLDLLCPDSHSRQARLKLDFCSFYSVKAEGFNWFTSDLLAPAPLSGLK